MHDRPGPCDLMMARRTTEVRSITKRTSQLPLVSKVLYRIDHVTSMPLIALGVIGAVFVSILVGAIIGFPARCALGIRGRVLLCHLAHGVHHPAHTGP